MSMTDPIADLLTRIRNGVNIDRTRVSIPHSRVKEQVCRVLKEEGFIEDYRIVEQPKKALHVFLKYGPEGEKIILYAGNFRPYQGLRLLLEAAANIEEVDVVFVLVGCRGKDGQRARKRAERLNISQKVRFIEEVPPDRIPDYLSAADVLVSPRLTGHATPLKIYSYLQSGTPIVATDIEAHSILNDKISILVKPDAESMAEGITFALFPAEAKKRARAAKEWAETRYTYSRYLDNMREALKMALGENRVA